MAARKTLTDIVDQVKLSGPDRHYQRSTNVQLENENYFELTRKSSLFSSHHIFTWFKGHAYHFYDVVVFVEANRAWKYLLVTEWTGQKNGSLNSQRPW